MNYTKPITGILEKAVSDIGCGEGHKYAYMVGCADIALISGAITTNDHLNYISRGIRRLSGRDKQEVENG